MTFAKQVVYPRYVDFAIDFKNGIVKISRGNRCMLVDGYRGKPITNSSTLYQGKPGAGTISSDICLQALA